MIASKNNDCIKYTSKLARPIVDRIGFMGLIILENVVKNTIKDGNKNASDRYL